MSQERIIWMAVKSSLDKIVGDLADQLSLAAPAANPVRCFDLDDHEGLRQVQSGAEHALVYQLGTLPPAPRHPLYSCAFLVGVKTTDDPGNYAMADMLVDVGSLFTIDQTFDLMDWSGDVVPVDILGSLYITGCEPAPQVFEQQAGIRMFAVQGRVIANG